MIDWNYYIGVNAYSFILNKRSSIDIDDELDLMIAEMLIQKKKRKIST